MGANTLYNLVLRLIELKEIIKHLITYVKNKDYENTENVKKIKVQEKKKKKTKVLKKGEKSMEKAKVYAKEK